MRPRFSVEVDRDRSGQDADGFRLHFRVWDRQIRNWVGPSFRSSTEANLFKLDLNKVEHEMGGYSDHPLASL